MDKLSVLWAIGPRNITDITLALFYVTADEVKKQHKAIALPLMDKLMQGWQAYSDKKVRGKNFQTQRKMLIRAARAMASILTPTAQKRLQKELFSS